MRLILKTKNRLVNVFWVEYRPNRVLGWYSGDWMKQQLGLPDDFPLEAHFHYPQDGNFHYSYKSFRKDCEEFVTVFWDKVKIKTIVNKEPETIWKTREEFKDNILGHMVQQFKAEPLEKAVHFQFVAMGFNVFNGDFKHSKFDRLVDEADIIETDLVVDVSCYDNYGLNITSLLRPIHTGAFVIADSAHFSKNQKITDSLILDLVCNVTKNES